MKEFFMKTKQKLFYGLIGILIVAMSTFSCGGGVKGDPPENFDFVIDGDAVYIKGYKGNNLQPVIPSKIQGKKVVKILDHAFNSKQLTGVTIPDSITTIGKAAFAYNQLTSVTIPNSVTTIGYFAFSYNEQLTSIIIPDSVTTIQDAAFYDNYQLTNVKIGANVELGKEPIWAGFEYYYNDNGKKAGTYTYTPENGWTAQFE
jgi:hypothetical protein